MLSRDPAYSFDHFRDRKYRCCDAIYIRDIE